MLAKANGLKKYDEKFHISEIKAGNAKAQSFFNNKKSMDAIKAQENNKINFELNDIKTQKNNAEKVTERYHNDFINLDNIIY